MNIKCNDYLDSLNSNAKIINNFKDILKYKSGKLKMDYNDLIKENFNKNLKDILIENNKNIIRIRLQDNMVYEYYHCRKINIINVINILKYIYY